MRVHARTLIHTQICIFIHTHTRARARAIQTYQCITLLQASRLTRRKKSSYLLAYRCQNSGVTDAE